MKIKSNKPVLGLTAAAVIVSPFFFGDRSRLNLDEVHPDLRAVAECAIKKTPVDFGVIDGLRTIEEQRLNMAKGVSWTIRSRHLEGKAIDFAAMPGGLISFDPKYYPPIADAFNQCSLELRIPIIWGGAWKVRDWGHIELDRKVYP